MGLLLTDGEMASAVYTKCGRCLWIAIISLQNCLKQLDVGTVYNGLGRVT
jgi:hypothetical protein